MSWKEYMLGKLIINYVKVVKKSIGRALIMKNYINSQPR